MGRKAIVIDDEPDITTHLSMLLSDNGWEVRTANNADEGLALAKEETPDVVLLDLMMPERGGMSTLVAIRKDERLSEVPVVVVSGIDQHVRNTYGPEEGFNVYMERARRFHANAFVEKPVDAEKLLKVLDEVTSEHAN